MDKLHMSVIKDALPVILPVLTELINRSLLTSVFPSARKESVVIPVLKEGDHETANNNRPEMCECQGNPSTRVNLPARKQSLNLETPIWLNNIVSDRM